MAFEFVFKLSRWPITGVKSPVKKKNTPAWLENALQTTLRCRSFLNNRDVFLWKGCCRADGCEATSSFWDIDAVYFLVKCFLLGTYAFFNYSYLQESSRYCTETRNIFNYRTRAIISRSRFEAALVYKPRILSLKN